MRWGQDKAANSSLFLAQLEFRNGPDSDARIAPAARQGFPLQRPHIRYDAAWLPHGAFFTNDEGLYVLDASVAASKLREIETPGERIKLLETYRAQRRVLRHGRLDIPRRIPPMSGHDLWDSNRPGSTLFLPVCDVSASLSLLLSRGGCPGSGHS
jgi:hypothetical protein